MRTILHIDMDAFFASVEELDDPSLRGKPVLVGGRARRGVVAAASYAARTFGIRSAMSMAEALQRCPHAIVLPPRRDRYAAISAQVFEIFGRYTPLVEGLSIDEAFLDVTASFSLFGDGESIAKAIKAAIRTELGLTASAGVARSKFVAKIASDLKKPDGLVVVLDDVAAFLKPLAIERMWGIGPKTAPRLRGIGYTTFGDLAAANERHLGQVLGSQASRAIRLARGEDVRDVIAHSAAKSIGSETTYEQDLDGHAAISRAILQHAEIIARRLTAEGLVARTITLKLKLSNFTLLSRQIGLERGVRDTQSIHEAGLSLLTRFSLTHEQIRLVGVSASSLGEEPITRELFPDRAQERRKTLESLLGTMRGKGIDGAAALTRATLHEGPGKRDTGVGFAREELVKLSGAQQTNADEAKGPRPRR